MSLDELESLVESGPKKGPAADRPVVVVVDDDAGIRSSLARVLKTKYEVRTCADGPQGVRDADKNTSCVILDVRMPTHDGFWVGRQIRKKAPDVPIIFHSAYQDTKNPYEIINELHPYGFVVKGEKVAELLSLVANAVKYSERLKEGRRQSSGHLVAARESLAPAREKVSSRPPRSPLTSRPRSSTR